MTPRRLNVVHTVASIAKRHGGPARSVPGLCEALARRGCGVRLLTVDDDRSGAAAPVDINLVELRKAPGIRLFGSHTFSRELPRTLLDIVGQSDILHSHGLWTHTSYASARVGTKRSIPFLISPRGTLEPWALKGSPWKKRLARLAYQNAALRSADCLHATAESEYLSIRRLGLRNPVAIVPNGINLAEFEIAPDRTLVDTTWPECRGKRLVLFLSRIHPKKGLLDLVTAWGKLAPRHHDWHLVVAGPDDGNHLSAVIAAATEAEVDARMTFTGPVYDNPRRQLLTCADFLVLPTFSENFGIVVAEALAAATPVLTTTGTPWKDLVAERCGWHVPPGAASLAETMETALSLPAEALIEMGLRGRSYVADKYGWAAIGREMHLVYLWLVGRAECPSCVVLD